MTSGGDRDDEALFLDTFLCVCTTFDFDRYENRVNLEKCRRGSVFVDVKKNMSDRLYSLSLRKNEGSLIVTWLNTRKIS